MVALFAVLVLVIVKKYFLNQRSTNNGAAAGGYATSASVGAVGPVLNGQIDVGAAVARLAEATDGLSQYLGNQHGFIHRPRVASVHPPPSAGGQRYFRSTHDSVL